MAEAWKSSAREERLAPETVREAVAGIRWFHTLDLGDGVVTDGFDDSPARLRRMRFPESFAGKTVLDVGAWDGFYSFEAERRGAERVLATDSFAWNGGNWGSRAGFDLVRRALGSQVEALEIDPLDLSPEKLGGTFDVVLFLGVLYHMRHPFLALERIASVTGELLILETETDCMLSRRPKMAFYPRTELAGDVTNWFGPNAAAVEGMLEAVGFSRVERAWQSSFPRRLVRAAKMRLSGGHPFLRGLGRDRMTFHAWKP
jgi:tRNA (mo5U34)-methyltransferase